MITYFIKAYKINSNPTTMLQSNTMLTSPVNLILFFAKGAIITQENRPIEFAMPVENLKIFMYSYHYVYIFLGLPNQEYPFSWFVLPIIAEDAFNSSVRNIVK